MIRNAGELIGYMQGAVEQANATPQTELFVRVGKLGPEYAIQGLTAQQDQRGLRLILELDPASASIQ